MGGGVGEPRAVVGDPRAHALPRLRQPPVLNVAFDELPCCCSQQVLARNLRSGGGERHAVLKLIAKAVGAACLIEGRAGPDTAGERLIEKPAVQHNVHRPIRRLHPDRTEDILPIPADIGQNGVKIGRAIARDQAPCLFRARSLAQKEHDFDGAVRWKPDGGAERGAGIKPCPNGVGERRRPGERCGVRERTVAANELPPVTRPVRLTELPPITRPVRLISVQIGKCDPRSESRVPRVAREHRAGQGINFRRHERSRDSPR